MNTKKRVLQSRTFLLDTDLVELLDQIEPGKRSEFVRQAIREKLAREYKRQSHKSKEGEGECLDDS